MSGVPAAPADDALLLAEWTQLDLLTLRRLYQALRRRLDGAGLRDPNDSGILAAVPEVPEEPLRSRLALCREAQRAGLLREFCNDVVGFEVDAASGRTDADAAPLYARILNVGRTQGVTNRAQGFGNPVIFRRLDRIFQATGYIQDREGRFLGTAFLIGRDRIITAAHVVLRREEPEGQVSFKPPVPGGVRVVFPQAGDREQRAGLHPDGPLLAYALPFVNTSGALLVQLTPDAAKQLDYAVLLLDRPILDVAPVPCDGLVSLQSGPLSFIIGYAGGSDPKWDADHITVVHGPFARFVHGMNSLPGMSGSCCVAEDGIAAGLHEGDWTERGVNGAATVRNRAVMLSAIRTHLGVHFASALHAGTAKGGALFGSALVQQLGRRGHELAGDAARERWLAMYGEVLGTDPFGPTAPAWGHHPYFTEGTGRNDVELWFAAAAEPGWKDRILGIGGLPGTGKSFCLERLAARLGEPVRDLLRIERYGTEGAVEALGKRLLAKAAGEATRTTSGERRYGTVEEVVSALGRFGGRDRAADARAHPLFIALDAGTDAEAGLASADWLSLLLRLVAEPWARVVVCGLAPQVRERLKGALRNDPATSKVRFDTRTLEHATADDVRAFVGGWPLPDGELPFAPDAVAGAFEQAMAELGAPGSLGTALAALLCIDAIHDRGAA